MTMSPSHRETLEAFGYTPEEAHFLYLVATHSGYFMARHYLAFTGAHPGKRTTLFRAKLQANKHVRTECFPKHGVVYHVFARKLYRHLGRENLGNDREHEIEYIQRHLAILDFVLAHRRLDFLETEQDKCRYFEQICGIAPHRFPSKSYPGHTGSQPIVRYFGDRFPMYLDSFVSPPVLTFSFIQRGEANLAEFLRHLKTYLPLFRELAAFRFIYLARTEAHFDKAREHFDSLVTIALGVNPAGDLLRYFGVRKAWDDRRYNALSEADLIFRNRAQRRFGAPRFEGMYGGWKTGRITDTQVREELAGNGTRHDVQFEPRLLAAVGANRPEAERNQ
ncbi:MAG TPA: hypothetical protein VK525_03520 [Candidatus Saccharimonadales bacterium]|nr:hypothetical protein [Candidatus Saccharimonadales bacterium]